MIRFIAVFVTFVLLGCSNNETEAKLLPPPEKQGKDSNIVIINDTMSHHGTEPQFFVKDSIKQ